MREIKFRMWNTVANDMSPTATLNEMFHIVGTMGFPEVHEQSIPMQYTGLKDKNGTEIYEDDILYIQWPEEGEGWDKVQVIWCDAGFRLLYDDILYDPHHMKYDRQLADIWDDPDSLVCEVIGNIYQNPDLLPKP